MECEVAYSKIGLLSSFLIEEKLDLMFLTETWLKCHDDPLISDSALLSVDTQFISNRALSGGVEV